MNRAICVDALGGICDEVGRDASRYGLAVGVAAVYDFLYPAASMIAWALLTAQFTLLGALAIWSVVLLPLLPALLGLSGAVFFLLLGLGVVIEAAFLLFLAREVGIYALLPIFASVAQVVFSVVPFVGSALARATGLLPWGILAVAVHFVHYRVGTKIFFNAAEMCYTREVPKEMEMEW